MLRDSQTAESPPIEVVIPVFNGEKFILRAIQSAESQTLPPKKIIVVNDGSTDRTAELVLNHNGRIPIQYVSTSNAGLSAARNAGIKLSEAEYIAFLDADDVWLPTKLEKQLQVFTSSSFENLGVVYCRYEIIDEGGEITTTYPIVPLDSSVRGHVFQRILPANKITGSASGVLVKRTCLDVVGGFDERLRSAEDWDMWLRLAQHFTFDYVNEVLVRIRRHGENMQNDEQRMYANILALYSKWIPRLPPLQEIPQVWTEFALGKAMNRLPRTDFMRTFCKSLPKNVQKSLVKSALHGRTFFLLKLAIVSPVWVYTCYTER